MIPFAAVSGYITLGDLIPVSNDSTPIDFTNYSIQFVGPTGGQMRIDDMKAIRDLDNWEAIRAVYSGDLALFFYVPEKSSWYLSADKASRKTGGKGGRQFPMNALKIKLGQGYTVNANDALKSGAHLTYSGQVVDTDQPYDVPCDTFDNSGNIAPTTMKLKDFIPSSKDSTPIDFTNFSIQFVGRTGAQMKVRDFANITAMENGEAIKAVYGDDVALFFYVPAAGATPAHWYLSADKATRKTGGKGGRQFPMDEMEIYAGQGFTINANDALKSGGSLLLPNALN